MSDVHQSIQAHLSAADRNPVKRAQHLIAATEYAEANGIAHFGRWSESAIHARHAVQVHREQERKIKTREPVSEPVEQSEKTHRQTNSQLRITGNEQFNRVS